MANKKNIKVRDLKPSKDAKGGSGRVLGANTLGDRTNNQHTLGATPNSDHKNHGHHGHGGN